MIWDLNPPFSVCYGLLGFRVAPLGVADEDGARGWADDDAAVGALVDLHAVAGVQNVQVAVGAVLDCETLAVDRPDSGFRV